MTGAPAKRPASLLERAANVYDFAAPARSASMPAEGPAAPARPAAVKVAGPSPRPVQKGRSATIRQETLAENGLLIPGAPVDVLAEEFRLLKRQLLTTIRASRATIGDRGRMVLICSANPNEGKTYCALNLALSMATEHETRVLLVDTDFGKPDILKRLGIDDGPGLIDILADPSLNPEDYVVATDLPQLSILPAGSRSNQDTELLASARTPEVLSALLAADPSRILLFDSPPALAASPAATLAHNVGHLLMIVRADRTTETDLRDAIGLLAACESVQLVLNSVSFAPGGRRFGTYYYREEPA